MIKIFEDDDPHVVDGTYNVFGYTPNEWKRKLKKEQTMRGSRELVRQTVEDLPVKLSDNELQLCGAQLASQTTDILATKAEQKEKRKEMRDDLKLLEEQRDELAKKIERGEEDRKVAVEIWYNNDALTVEKVRTDTGERFESRKMTEEEMQRPLPA